MIANGMKDSLKDLSALLSPSALCHVVLKTTPDGYKPMVDFYLTFLGGRITHGNERITFITYDMVRNLTDRPFRDVVTPVTISLVEQRLSS